MLLGIRATYYLGADAVSPKPNMGKPVPEIPQFAPFPNLVQCMSVYVHIRLHDMHIYIYTERETWNCNAWLVGKGHYSYNLFVTTDV